ncbi:transporter [Terrilactibacillus sp. BCM23-1]|uniref:Transporter n=1 Tax=Terrilactibacillus tamarindi TaxID=2599694 RepID=A0A6N8CWI1_9BACI|nr:LysE family transporter [Terrilactibacillus tamarindi]MTT33016.1 transporter [Terrilactibacillus tamarindi]
MSSFMQGFALGMMLQLSIGPVFFGVLHLSISKGILAGIKMTCAVMLVDALYICLSFTVITSILKIETIRTIILFLCLLTLLYFGYSYIKKARHKNIETKPHVSSSFLYGLKLTLINPLTIIFWSSMFGSLLAGHNLLTRGDLVLYALGAIFATFVFLVFTSLFGHLIKKVMNVRLMRSLDYFIGIILIYYGLVTFFNRHF